MPSAAGAPCWIGAKSASGRVGFDAATPLIVDGYGFFVVDVKSVDAERGAGSSIKRNVVPDGAAARGAIRNRIRQVRPSRRIGVGEADHAVALHCLGSSLQICHDLRPLRAFNVLPILGNGNCHENGGNYEGNHELNEGETVPAHGVLRIAVVFPTIGASSSWRNSLLPPIVGPRCFF